MADETDVENVIVGICTGALYPNGTSQACAAAVPGGVRVLRGYPTVQEQEQAKKLNFVNVSVSARNGVERSTTRFVPIWRPVTPASNTITVTVSNNTVTLSGTVSVPQNVMVLIGQYTVFNYAVQPSDTLTTIAAALATLINAQFADTTSSGAVITIADTLEVQARVAGAGVMAKEVGRQDKSFQVSVWAPPVNSTGIDSDTWRTAVVKVISPVLRGLIRIVMPDQYYAHMRYERTITMDAAESQGLYRRDLYFWVEYAETITATAYEIGAFQNTLAAATINPQTVATPLTNNY